ncbi:MAG TPA: lipopolysaccharide heptosyltransferase family protein [Thiotrichaceae bacterium]|nr:lipopolysaccharide heptosyltransferase family protein [Thiotrichaceae bacterium]
MSVKKILFIGLSSVGDVVMTTPVLQSLQNKYPEALFDIVVDKRGTGLYKNYPRLNKLYLKDKDRLLRGVPDLLLQLWKNRYDLVVDVRTDGLAYLLRAKKRYTKWSAKSYGPHAVEKLMGVIAKLHGDKPIPPTNVWLSDEDRAYAKKETSVFESKERLLTISMGDSRKPEKTWLIDKFVELLNKHENDFSGVIFLGNSHEAKETKEVANSINIRHINTVDNSLLEAAALIERSCLYIGPDSGLGHIAAAVKTPTISFFGVTEPERYRPWGGRANCLTGINNDARNIPVDEVSLAIKGVLK